MRLLAFSAVVFLPQRARNNLTAKSAKDAKAELVFAFSALFAVKKLFAVKSSIVFRAQLTHHGSGLPHFAFTKGFQFLFQAFTVAGF